MLVPASLLVVDDDTALRQMLDALLRDEGYRVTQASSSAAALRLARERDYDVVLSDIKMPGESGFDLLAELKRIRPRTRVVLMSAFGGEHSAEDALRAGAFGYAAKPLEPDAVLEAVGRALEARAAGDDTEPAPLTDLIGHGPAMRELRALVRRVASSQSSVLITGESGTGKEVVARGLHTCGPRAAHPFVAVNCTAIPEGLLESELFGHVRGAFTGATASKTGLFERADRGTLFLDEIGDMGPELQAKLLRVLQESEIQPVGGSHSLKVDVRVIAATHRDLDARIAVGAFREDLFYRLNVIPVHLPPLRERPEDIPGLIDVFLRRHTHGPARSFSKAAIAWLQQRAWRGNARELENLVERALALSDAEPIDVADLPLPEASDPIASHPGCALRRGLAVAARRGLKLQEVMDLYIGEMLAFTDGKKAEAARRLGIDRKTLYRHDPTREAEAS